MLDLNALSDAIEAHGTVVRIVVAEVKGSAPREAGAAMLVWEAGAEDTIGGGALEWQATAIAREMLEGGPDTRVIRRALGPDIGQCCGGAVTLVAERYDAARYRDLDQGFEFQGIWARQVEAGEAPLPDTTRRRIEKFQWSDTAMPTTLTKGWLIEPVWRDQRPVYIYGAGHVGRALARVLAPMPAFDVWLVDVRAPMFEPLPENIHISEGILPDALMKSAPPEAAHFIMTPEHDYDLHLCDTLLRQPFAYGGLIGSATKWARFRSRLKALGHDDAQIGRIHCPIGDPSLGKHPQAIAIGVAQGLLSLRGTGESAMPAKIEAER